MARKANAEANFTIAELQRLLGARQRELDGLKRKRESLQAKIAQIDQQIAALGPGGTGGGGRVRNATSLMDSIEAVLRNNGGPMKVGDIVEGVTAAGYQSNSANFRGIVNQALIKDKRFVSAGRGMYQLKK
jgi:hypothetical protein